jgi:hypothetical protein
VFKFAAHRQGRFAFITSCIDVGARNDQLRHKLFSPTSARSH